MIAWYATPFMLWCQKTHRCELDTCILHPNRRGGPTRSGSGHDSESTQDPDNVPPRSRLFLVVPKTGDPAAVEVCPHAVRSNSCLSLLWACLSLATCKIPSYQSRQVTPVGLFSFPQKYDAVPTHWPDDQI